MATSREKTFGSRYNNALFFVNFVSNLQNYNPPNILDRVPALNDLLQSIKTTNETHDTNLSNYNSAVVERQNAIFHNDLSVAKILSPIRSALTLQFGKKSVAVSQFVAIATNIRPKKPVTYTDKSTNIEQKISQSQMSYGSIIRNFTNIVSLLQNNTAYAPPIPELEATNLHSLATNLDTLTQNVNHNFQTIFTTKKNRNEAYDDLSSRISRAKLYIKLIYGASSVEFSKLKNLVV